MLWLEQQKTASRTGKILENQVRTWHYLSWAWILMEATLLPLWSVTETVPAALAPMPIGFFPGRVNAVVLPTVRALIGQGGISKVSWVPTMGILKVQLAPQMAQSNLNGTMPLTFVQYKRWQMKMEWQHKANMRLGFAAK